MTFKDKSGKSAVTPLLMHWWQ